MGVGDRPYGQKCSDRESIPLCFAHGVTDQHSFGRGKDGKRGFFAAMSKGQRAEWYREQIAECHRLYERAAGASF